MALECQETEEFSVENFVGSPSDEETPLNCFTFPVLSAPSKPKCSKTSSKSITQEPDLCGPLRKEGSKSGSTKANDSGPNGHHRSFSDLPANLVSEILKCLDAKELE